MTFWQILFIAVACVGCYYIGHFNGWNQGWDAAESIWKAQAVEIGEVWQRAMERVAKVIESIGDAVDTK